MASQIKTTQNNVVSAMKASGIFSAVQTFEPPRPPDKGLTAAIYASSAMPIAEGSGLRAASALYVFTISIYSNALKEPVDSIDIDLVQAIDKLFDLLAGDVDLGATVKEIDVFGHYGQPLKADWRYITPAGGGEYRVADVVLPLVVNDVWSFG